MRSRLFPKIQRKQKQEHKISNWRITDVVTDEIIVTWDGENVTWGGENVTWTN